MKLQCKQVMFILLVLAFLTTSYKSLAQEICNNSIDDDGDGLTDLYDPECQCHVAVTGNLLQNGSFEQYDHCPVYYTYDKENNIADYWKLGSYVNIGEAYFYHNLKCAYDSEQVILKMPPTQPLPDGNGFVSIQNNSSVTIKPEKELTKSYVGQCLQAPLKKGEAYTLSLYGGRSRSWDNLTGDIYPFTVAVFGNANCNAVPFGKAYVLGNGCPANYDGWIFLGNTTIYTDGHWVQSKINFTVPYDINVIEIGPDCYRLPEINDQADSTTFLDYHEYYLDDMHLLPTKDFPFEYIQTQTGIDCNGLRVLKAPVVADAVYQWYKDSVAIKNATGATYQVADTKGISYYNVLITTPAKCITSEPFLITPSKLNEIKIPGDTIVCSNDTVLLAKELDGITYTLNGATTQSVTINKEGIYNIIASDVFGCSKTFNVRVVQQSCSDCNAFVPNAFTPNGDGLNDLFKTKFYCFVSQYHIQIYNRWGRQIFESSNISEGWNGTLSGIKLPAGTYIYLIKYKTSSGVRKIVKGIVSLVM